MPASVLVAVAGCSAAVSVACCVAWGRMHWGGIFGADFAIVAAMTSLLLQRSRLGWGMLALAILSLLACGVVGHPTHGLH